MSRIKTLSATLTFALIALMSVNVHAASTASLVNGGIQNFGEYLGTFAGPDGEDWFQDVYHIDVTLLATIESPALSAGGLSIINPVFDVNGGLISGQWVYSGPEIVTYLTFGRGPIFSLFEFADGANTGYFDASTLLNRPIDFISVYSTAAPIPLPAAFWLLLSGVVGVFGLGKRRK